MCDQQSLRSACAYVQADQSLCLSLEYSMSVKQLAEHNLEFLSLKGGCTSSSESTLVMMSHCSKSHAAAQFYDSFAVSDPDRILEKRKRKSAALDFLSADSGGKFLTLKAPITTAADDKFCDIFPNFQQK